jgi:hypothetical protein
LTPEREEKMSADERDAAIRKLLAEVERHSRVEFERGAKTPPGERTVFWDPLVRVCKSLGISRTKLSGYSRELTGLRAHEVTDRIKAGKLRETMHVWVAGVLNTVLAAMEKTLDRSRLSDKAYRQACLRQCLDAVKHARSGAARGTWSYELGYPSPSQVSRACLLAHGMAIADVESALVQRIVQKFFDERMDSGTGFQPVKVHGQDARAANAPPPALKRKALPAPMREKAPASTQARTRGEQIIEEVVAEMMREKFAGCSGCKMKTSN